MEIETPFGKPSGKIEIGKINGVEVAFIPRHAEALSYLMVENIANDIVKRGKLDEKSFIEMDSRITYTLYTPLKFTIGFD